MHLWTIQGKVAEKLPFIDSLGEFVTEDWDGGASIAGDCPLIVIPARL